MSKKETLHIYTRVSTSNQVEGTSLEIQKDNGIQLSKKIGMEYKIWNEGHGSGFEEFSEFRPVFSRLLDKIKSGEVKNIFVKDLSRLTRNEIDSYKINSLLLQNGVSLYTTDGKYDLTNLENGMMYKILTMFNEYQVKVSRIKSIEGKVKRVKEGKYMLSIPFGYIREDGWLKEHPENGKWLVKIFEWYKNGKSSVDIRNELFKNNVKPLRSDTGMFPPETIQKILRNKTYTGTHTFTDKESGMTFTNDNLPLINKKLFYDVQKRLDQQGYGKNHMKYEHLLRDIVTCPCGTFMNTRKEGKDKVKNPSLYRCRNQDRTYMKRKKVCDDCIPMRSIKMNPLNEFVWETLLDTLKKSSLIKETTRKEILGKKSTYGKRTIKNKIKKLNDEKINLDNMRLELEKEYYSGQMKPDRYKVLVGSVNDREYQIDKEISIKETELDTIIQKDKWLDWIDIHLSNVDDLNKVTDVKERKKVIKKYVNNIVVNWNGETKQHTITMSMKLPLVNDGIKYKKGKKGQFLKDRKGFKKYDIIDGKTNLTNPYLHLNSLNRYTFS
ncbi:MAG: recombinase family protein [Candidatus Neomarinimicrobiota bacterium]